MRSAKGFTLIELLIVVAVVAIIAAIAIPGLLRARMAGNEASAIASLRAINSGEAAFASSCAKGGFAISLADLAKAPGGARDAFIGPDLVANGIVKAGYAVALTRDQAANTVDVGTAAATCNASANIPASSYYAAANPIGFGSSGTRYFGTDSRGAIFQDTTAVIGNPLVPSATTVPVQ